MIFYNEKGDTWKVELGLKRQNGRWYEPVNDKELIDLLYELTMDQAFYNDFLTAKNMEQIANYCY